MPWVAIFWSLAGPAWQDIHQKSTSILLIKSMVTVLAAAAMEMGTEYTTCIMR